MTDVKIALTALVIFIIGVGLVNLFKPNDDYADTWKTIGGSIILVSIILFVFSAVAAIWIRVP